MKKKYAFIFAAAVAALCSCTHEETPAGSGFKTITISAYAEDASTKSSRDAEGSFYWSPGDEISLFLGDGNDGGWRLTNSRQDPADIAEFEGEVPEEVIDNPNGKTFWGIYPFRKENSVAGDVLTTVVPQNQKAAKGTFADGQFVSVGQSDKFTIGFYHLCGGIKFTLLQPGVSEIRLKGNAGEILAGTVKVVLDEEGYPVVKEVIEGMKEVVLSCSEGFEPGVEYFIVTLPVTLKDGFTVDFGDGRSRTVETALEIHRAKFQWSSFPLDDEGEYVYEECDIENEGVRRFLESVDYSSDPDYAISEARNYVRMGSDEPRPISIVWSGPAKVLELSNSPSFDSVLKKIEVSSSSVDIYNLIPGEHYYYRVLAENGIAIKRGCVMPIGPERMIYGVSSNVRDLGGWTVKGGHIAYGRLYRGARLDDIQRKPASKAVLLEDLGVSVDLDLRGLAPGSQGGSGEMNPWMPGDSIEYCNIKLWHYFVPSVSLYNIPPIADGASADQYQLAIRTIIGWLGEGRNIYFHCHGGSDRTGTLAFLIEALLGVSESDLSKDYELTSFTGSYRLRNGEAGWFFAPMVKYIRRFAPEGSIGDQVYAWATMRHSDSVDPLSVEEIDLLREFLVVKD